METERQNEPFHRFTHILSQTKSQTQHYVAKWYLRSLLHFLLVCFVGKSISKLIVCSIRMMAGKRHAATFGRKETDGKNVLP